MEFLRTLAYIGIVILVFWAVKAVFKSRWFSKTALPALFTGWTLRWPLFLCLVPAVIGLFAFKDTSTLSTLLVLHDEPVDGYQSLLLRCLLLSPNLFYLDLIYITFTSFLMVSLGIAGWKLVWLYGPLRFTSICSSVSPQLPLSESRHFGTVSYLFLVGLGSALPLLFVVPASVTAQGLPTSPPPQWLSPVMSGYLAVFYGIVLAGLFLVAFVVLELMLQGTETSPVGMFPFENLPFLPENRKGRGALSPIWNRLAKWLDGPGYTEEDPVTHCPRLLPGHAQLMLLTGLWSAVYVMWTIGGSSTVTWNGAYWPCLVYLEVIVMIVGTVLMGVAFWSDRYHLPPFILATLWVIAMYYTGQTDNFYELSPTLSEKQKRAAIAAFERKDGAPPPFLQALSGREFGTPNGEKAKKQFRKNKFWKTLATDGWKQKPLPKGPDGKPTLVFITAAGGGIQAAAWTAKVLCGLDNEFDGFRESIGLISGVSGGSVGTMYYLGHSGGRSASTSHNPERAYAMASASLLEPVGWGAAFPDFVRNVFPFFSARYIDRGWALEASCWERMGRDPSDRYCMQDLRMLDLTRAFQNGDLPAVVFNATAVETGQRVLIGSVSLLDPDDHSDYNLVNEPIEWFEYYRWKRAKHEENVDPRVTTAVRLSASFSYAAPVARPADDDLVPLADSEPDGDEHVQLGRQARIHLCDGGYASNSGLITIIKLVDELIDKEGALRAQDVEGMFSRMLIVRIEPFPPTIARYSREQSGFYAQALGPMTAMGNVRVSTQSERDELELELLAKRAASAGVDLKHIVLQFGGEDKSDEMRSPPLSWKLIPTAERAIQSRWRSIMDGDASDSAPTKPEGAAIDFRGLSQFFKRRAATPKESENN